MLRHTVTVFVLLLLPLQVIMAAENKNSRTKPTQTQQAHDFFAYLVKLGVIDIDVTKKCYSDQSTPKTIQYIQEACSSTFVTSYTCKKGKDKHITNTQIDWYYVSEMIQSGYSGDGKEINISGKITESYSDGKATKMSQSESTKQAKITFDSASTAKRALKAFTLLRNECDTSKNFSF